jgi:phospholipase/carboxylesterase
VSKLLSELFATLEAFAWAQRRLHPPWAPRLVEALGPLRSPLAAALDRVRALDWPEGIREEGGRLESAAAHALEALDRFAGAAIDPMPVYALYRAVRRHLRALEDLYPLWPVLPPVNRFFLDESARGDAALLGRLAAAAERRAAATTDSEAGAMAGDSPRAGGGPPAVESGPGPGGRSGAPGSPPVGLIDHGNDRAERGGFTLFVPEHWDGTERWPLVVALHGGSGHGADFVWTWVREARSRGFVVLSPTARDDTWSLFAPALDGDPMAELVDRVAATWNLDRSRILLTGISDGATFSLLYGLRPGTPFTHLAPISGVLAPLDPPERAGAAGKPVYLVHGALDWMFPVQTARLAQRELERWGARVVYREIEDLSHTYPREENARILDWLG